MPPMQAASQAQTILLSLSGSRTEEWLAYGEHRKNRMSAIRNSRDSILKVEEKYYQNSKEIALSIEKAIVILKKTCIGGQGMKRRLCGSLYSYFLQMF